MDIVRSTLIVIILGLICAFIQGALLGQIMHVSFIPNFLLIIVVYLAFFESSSLGAFLAFVAGLILDITSGVLLGPWATSFVVVFAVFSVLSQRIFVESFLAAFLSVFFASLMASGVCLSLFYGFQVIGPATLKISVMQGFVSGLLAPIGLGFLRHVLRGSDNSQMSSLLHVGIRQTGKRL